MSVKAWRCLEVQAFSNEVLQGTVAYVEDVVAPTMRITKVRYNLNNPNHKLKPEMFVRIHITKPVAESLVLAVSEEAVITIGNEAFVFMAKNETEYKRRNVVAGPTSGDLVKIHEGLKAGERAVVKGALLTEYACADAMK